MPVKNFRTDTDWERALLTNRIMELVVRNNLPYTNVSVPLMLGDPEDIPR